jgi:non-heme chloroperoxidase
MMATQEHSLKTIDVNNTNLHYVEVGEHNSQPVIFTPAALTDYRVWQFQTEPFSREYRVISYSRRHSYPNKVEEDFHFTGDNNGIKQYASDLAELIRKLHLGPAHLVGHSDGAFVTLFCAMGNPELVKSMVLGEPPIFPLLAASPAELDQKMFQGVWVNAIMPAVAAFQVDDYNKGIRIFLDGVMAKGYFDSLAPPIQQSMMDNAKAFKKQGENPMPRTFDLQELNRISHIPVLFVKGEKSPAFYQRIIDMLVPHLPKSEQVTIPGVTHDLGRATRADIFNTRVMEFLRKNSSSQHVKS